MTLGASLVRMPVKEKGIPDTCYRNDKAGFIRGTMVVGV